MRPHIAPHQALKQPSGPASFPAVTSGDLDQDVVLGRTLAETARLNSPATQAGRAAKETVRRKQVSSMDAAARRRVFRLAMLLLAILTVMIAAAAVLLRPSLAP